MRLFISLIPLLAAAIVMCGCETAPVETDPDAYRLKGTLSGWAEIIDYTAPNSIAATGGLTISVDGTNYKTISDSTGHWAIRDLPAGTYTVSCTKDGFGTDKVFNVQFVGGGDLALINSLRIAPIPSDITVTNFRFDGVKGAGENGTLSFSGTLPDTLPPGIRMLVFIAKDTNINITESHGISPLHYSVDVSRGTGGFTLKYLYEAGFKSGDRVYGFAHVFNNYGNACEFADPFRRITIRTAINPVRSNVVSFTMP